MTDGHRRHIPTPVLAIACILILGVPLLLIEIDTDSATDSVRQESEAADRDALFAACRGGNLRSAYELANKDDGPDRTQLAEDTLPIINCDVLVKESRRLAVSLDTQEEFIRIVVEDRRWPVLEDGEIVGTEELPGIAPRQGDPDASTEADLIAVP